MKFGELSKVQHGGAMQIKKRGCNNNILDFSASLNPYPPEIEWDPSSISISEYPDDSYTEIKESIASYFKCRPEQICVGNGSIEVIRAYFQAVLSPHENVFVDRHTFGEYGLSINLAGGELTKSLSDYRVRVICNPNNPTGSIMKKDEILAIADENYNKKRLLFIDEAFMDLSDSDETLIGADKPGIFISRSLTKSFSVPGIRFGFGIGEPELIEEIEIVRTPWTVNSYAASFCIEAVKQYDKLEESRKKIRAEKHWLYRKFQDLGIEYNPSYTNYILLKCLQPASELTDALLKYGIFVRDCTSFGLPGCIRIAVRKHEENELLLEAMESCLH